MSGTRLTKLLLISVFLVMLVVSTACHPLPNPLPSSSPLLPASPRPPLSSTPTVLSPPPTATHLPTATHPPSPINTPEPDVRPTPSLTATTTQTTATQTTIADPPPRPFDALVVQPVPPRRVPNAIRMFWVLNGDTSEWRQITARLRVQTAHVAMWVEEGVWHDVRQLEQAAHVFETQIYTPTRQTFGSEWTPGVDNDPHIHILHATGLGKNTLGYTSSDNEFPHTQQPYSNEAEMITVHMDAVEIGSPRYFALLAAQFQRLIQWAGDRNEEQWIKDGLSALAIRQAGFDPYTLLPPENIGGERVDSVPPLTTDLISAYQFLTYFHHRFDDQGVQALVIHPLNGRSGFEAVLAGLRSDLTFDDLFADWLVSRYREIGSASAFRPPSNEYPMVIQASVSQWGADWVSLPASRDLHVRFSGVITAPLPGIPAHSGQYAWWSGRADNSRVTLTRWFDLTTISTTRPITLTYWTWYALEAGYDYATVEVSSDDGETWDILPTILGSDEDPYGNNPGWGYTGYSHPQSGWVSDTVDLSAYGGKRIGVRFAYWTDSAHTEAGWLLDDIALPAIGYNNDVEGGTDGWEAAGFVRSDGSIPQHYLVLRVLPTAEEEPGDESLDVERMAIGEGNQAEWDIPVSIQNEGRQEVVLLIAAIVATTAPLTGQPAPYRLELDVAR